MRCWIVATAFVLVWQGTALAGTCEAELEVGELRLEQIDDQLDVADIAGRTLPSTCTVEISAW